MVLAITILSGVYLAGFFICLHYYEEVQYRLEWYHLFLSSVWFLMVPAYWVGYRWVFRKVLNKRLKKGFVKYFEFLNKEVF